MGLQFIGAEDDEQLLLEVAGVYQRSNPFKIPPNFRA
jgi:Asp-tRNA(Asn)/Glu-tRNA(Gln) amidotransferase A subunit family amidase